MIIGLVSIILPVYNQKDFIKESLDSILAQEYAFFELIIINDGSTDNLSEAVNKYTDPRIKYHELPHQGLAKTLNYGLRLANGEFITWFSADNIMHPTMLCELVAALRKAPSHSAAFSGYFHIDANGQVTGHNAKGPYRNPSEFLDKPNRDFFLAQHCNFGAAFLYRASACRQAGDFDPLCDGIEDVDYSIRIAKCGPVTYIPKLLCYYRWHANSMGGRERRGEVTFNPGRTRLWAKIASGDLAQIPRKDLVECTSIRLN